MARPKSFNKEQVLGAAMLVFWQKGYDATSMKDLERATQLTPGSIYHEFGSKLGMFELVLNHYVEVIMVFRVNLYLVDSDDPVVGIRNFLVSLFDGVPKELQGCSCLVVNTATELGDTQPVISAVLKRGFRVVEQGLQKQLLLAQSKGHVRENLDCNLGARQLAIMMSGLVVASKNQHRTEDLIATVDFTLSAYR